MNQECDQLAALENLYHRAFEQFGTIALWNMRPAGKPTKLDALAITPALRGRGGMEGRRLAERIEALPEISRAMLERQATPES